MKQFVTFLRSMKFGIIILILVMVCSLIGSLIPQDRSDAWYINNYPGGFGELVLKLGFNDLFRTWYFILLVSLLGINLTLCSVIRFAAVHKAKKTAIDKAMESEDRHFIGAETAVKIRAFLAGKRYKQREDGGTVIFYRNMTGYYGSFLVHLSLLFILVFGGLVLGLSDVTDYNVLPGETVTLKDGTLLEVEYFRTTDDEGRTDYVSLIFVTTPDGKESHGREISVNYPFTFNSLKYYQHTYGVAGSVTALNTTTGGTDVLYLTEKSFLSADGRNGMWFEALYPGYVEDEHGHIIPLYYNSAGYYPNPIYQVLVSAGGHVHSYMLMPGNIVDTGLISFEFNDPVAYPGIRVKRIPYPFPALLYASFVLITLGFWLCFFHMPALVTVSNDSYAITGQKTQAAQFEIDTFLDKLKETN